MSRATNLDAAIDSLCSKIAWGEAHNGPDITHEGKTVQKQSFLRDMNDRLDKLLNLRQKIDGAFMVKTRGFTR